MPSQSLETIWTIARIADHVEAQRHRVEYVIRSRGIIPTARAGIARVFDRTAVDRVAHALISIEADRKGRPNAK